MADFALERLEDVIEEMRPLLMEHWAQMAVHYPESTFSPNVRFYTDVDNVGALRIYTVRIERVLVGYAVIIVAPHPHREDDIVGVFDAFYVQPQFRFGASALHLLRFAEDALRAEGVNIITVATRDNVLARWFRSFGHFTQTETVWERRL